jgi:hypothetical protein
MLVELSSNVTSYVDTGLQPGMEYTYRIASRNAVGESSSDHVSVEIPTEYRYWANENIGLAIGEPDEDQDGDGYSNYLEYLLDGDPLVYETGMLLTGFEDIYGLGEYFTLSVDMIASKPADALSVDSTDDLMSGSWSTATYMENTVSNGMRQLKFRSPTPVSEAPSQFLRLK